jgi:hypothetical protein
MMDLLNYDSESVSTIEFHDEDTLSQEESIFVPIDDFGNSHLYFDNDGNEVSREQYLSRNTVEDIDEWGFRTPNMPRNYTIREPRVLLHFLRFIDSMNETNGPEETVMMTPISREMLTRIFNHELIRNPPMELQPEANELIERIMRHANLS